MHETINRTRAEFEQDTAEMLAGEAPPTRMNGPGLLMFCEPDTPQPATGMLLVQPMRHYDELILQVEWKMVDPGYRALFDLVQTIAEFPCDEGTAWTPLREQYDPRKSTWMMCPSQLCSENLMRLRYRGLHVTAIGAKLLTSPVGAPLRARIWTLLLGHGEERTDAEGRAP